MYNFTQTNPPYIATRFTPLWRGKVTYIGSRRDLYWSPSQPILVHSATYIGPRGDQYSSDQRPI
ncbi:hypothetical protein HMPREF3185_00143 [Porphyromonas somerae]|uniref:Uncharacterized protein n=1 Tax=Porphyromonas somerae TaxID=322095 RepID=A0A134BEX9_9PORP|nr:hypothetical protein HMPREF3184_00143 [Porphyromonadaceae bacterium KA00676]KXB78495.1 hypothetical protein HMPREF3185_00143 [Porphyromonas somerae]